MRAWRTTRPGTVTMRRRRVAIMALPASTTWPAMMRVSSSLRWVVSWCSQPAVAAPKSQAPRFLELLADLLRPDPVTAPGLIGAGTIRADRYEPLQTAPELAGVRSVVFDDLKPMPQAQFKEVIVGPGAAGRAERARSCPSPRIWWNRCSSDWSRGAVALPLLSLTLARLIRTTAEGDLTLGDYEALGRIAARGPAGVDELLDDDPRSAPGRAGDLATGVHAVAGDDQLRATTSRCAAPPAGPTRPAGQASVARGVGRTQVAGQGRARRGNCRRGRAWKACCANGTSWPDGWTTPPSTRATADSATTPTSCLHRQSRPVGRVSVDHVNLPGGERLIFHGRQQRADFAEAEPVGAAEAGEPVLPTDEVGREPGPERRARARRSLSVRSPSRWAVSRRTAMA